MTRRTTSVAITIEGFFAAAWFGWGSANEPSWLQIATTVGAVLGLAAMGCGLGLGRRVRAEPRSVALRDRTYWLVLPGEAVVAIGGAAVLGASEHSSYISAWVALVVGAHFFPLARLFGGASMIVVGGLICAIALGAIGVGLADAGNPQLISTAGVGAILLISALTLLASTATRSRDEFDTTAASR